MKVCGGPLIKMGRIGDVFFSCNDFIRSATVVKRDRSSRVIRVGGLRMILFSEFPSRARRGVIHRPWVVSL
jgi:hypothetical protein